MTCLWASVQGYTCLPGLGVREVLYCGQLDLITQGEMWVGAIGRFTRGTLGAVGDTPITSLLYRGTGVHIIQPLLLSLEETQSPKNTSTSTSMKNMYFWC